MASMLKLRIIYCTRIIMKICDIKNFLMQMQMILKILLHIIKNEYYLL